MKRTLFRKIFLSTVFFVVVFFSAAAIAASTGTIDPNGLGYNKAAFLDNSIVSNTAINFGKFTTESQYNITVSDTELRGYAWGSSVGYMVMNCADTTSGCNSTNGNFKVANTSGLLSDYAWGENTGWINFGPFTDTSISTVKIDPSTGNFEGTNGSAGYAWSQNYGWIVFDCTSTNTCVNTDWRPATLGGTQGGTSGGSPTSGGGTNGSFINVQASSVLCDSAAAMPHWGTSATPLNINSSTAADYVANSGGHCWFTAGRSFQWGDHTAAYVAGNVIGPSVYYAHTFGPTDVSGIVHTTIPFITGSEIFHLREILQMGDVPFSAAVTGTATYPTSAEFYCQTDGKNYDNYDFFYLTHPLSGATYACVAFNLSKTKVTNPNPPSTTTPPPGNSTAPSTPTGPIIQGTPPGSSPTTSPTSTTTEPPNNPAESTNEPGPFTNGLQLPPAFIEALGNMFSIARSVVSQILNAAGTTTGSEATKAAAGLGLAVMLGGLIGDPLALWNLLFVFMGKKREHPWGTVYDSVTKQPIDPAYVVLMDMQGNEVATCITDIDGRYGFAVPPGTYTIVVNKTNFEFPSKKLFGKPNDELYNSLYFGETIVITKQDEVIIKNIPMDKLNFDWNEFAKTEQKRLSYYKHSDLFVARASNFFFWLGFMSAIVALLISHTLYNGIIFLLYIIFLIIRTTSVQFKPKGFVTDATTDQPLPFAILHVLSKVTGQEIIHKVTDHTGGYYCLLPNGTYQVIIDRKNADGSYTKITVSEPIVVTQGLLKKEFKI